MSTGRSTESDKITHTKETLQLSNISKKTYNYPCQDTKVDFKRSVSQHCSSNTGWHAWNASKHRRSPQISTLVVNRHGLDLEGKLPGSYIVPFSRQKRGELFWSKWPQLCGRAGGRGAGREGSHDPVSADRKSGV